MKKAKSSNSSNNSGSTETPESSKIDPAPGAGGRTQAAPEAAERPLTKAGQRRENDEARRGLSEALSGFSDAPPDRVKGGAGRNERLQGARATGNRSAEPLKIEAPEATEAQEAQEALEAPTELEPSAPADAPAPSRSGARRRSRAEQDEKKNGRKGAPKEAPGESRSAGTPGKPASRPARKRIRKASSDEAPSQDGLEAARPPKSSTLPPERTAREVRAGLARALGGALAGANLSDGSDGSGGPGEAPPPLPEAESLFADARVEPESSAEGKKPAPVPVGEAPASSAASESDADSDPESDPRTDPDSEPASPPWFTELTGRRTPLRKAASDAAPVPEELADPEVAELVRRLARDDDGAALLGDGALLAQAEREREAAERRAGEVRAAEEALATLPGLTDEAERASLEAELEALHLERDCARRITSARAAFAGALGSLPGPQPEGPNGRAEPSGLSENALGGLLALSREIRILNARGAAVAKASPADPRLPALAREAAGLSSRAVRLLEDELFAARREEERIARLGAASFLPVRDGASVEPLTATQAWTAALMRAPQAAAQALQSEPSGPIESAGSVGSDSAPAAASAPPPPLPSPAPAGVPGARPSRRLGLPALRTKTALAALAAAAALGASVAAAFAAGIPQRLLADAPALAVCDRERIRTEAALLRLAHARPGMPERSELARIDADAIDAAIREARDAAAPDLPLVLEPGALSAPAGAGEAGAASRILDITDEVRRRLGIRTSDLAALEESAREGWSADPAIDPGSPAPAAALEAAAARAEAAPEPAGADGEFAGRVKRLLGLWGGGPAAPGASDRTDPAFPNASRPTREASR